MLECVVNVSEGRDPAAIRSLASSAGADLLDIHSDPFHHRSVLSLLGSTAIRNVCTRAVETLDLGHHKGVHPRLGVVDVVPFVPLLGSTFDDAVAARNDFARWAGEQLGIP